VVGDSISSNMFIIVPANPTEFYRIEGRWILVFLDRSREEIFGR